MSSKLRVETWANHKNPAMAFFTIQHALFARMKCKTMRHIKERTAYGHYFPLPDFPSWFAMYRSRRPVLAYKRLVSHNSEFDQKQLDLFSDLKKLGKQLKKKNIELNISPDAKADALKEWQGMLSSLFDEIRDDIANTALVPEVQEKLEKALVNDELPLGFYFLVYAPCLEFYQTSPASLYRKALNRDVDAIASLLKIDPLVMHDPAVGFQIQSIRLHGKVNDYELILDAITSTPKLNYKTLSNERRSIKSDQGAKAFGLALELGHKWESQEIRELFNALAADYDGSQFDDDIKKLDSFDRTIRAKAADWRKQFHSSEKQK